MTDKDIARVAVLKKRGARFEAIPDQTPKVTLNKAASPTAQAAFEKQSRLELIRTIQTLQPTEQSFFRFKQAFIEWLATLET